MGRSTLGAALAAMILSARVAGAQDSSVRPPAPQAEADADAFFRAGSAAFAKGELRAAAQSFEEAYRRAPRAASIYNAAAAWDAAGENGRALEAFEIALGRDDLDAALATPARERVAALREKLGCLALRAPAGWTATTAHAERRATPTRVCVAPGEHSVRFEASDGHAVLRVERVDAGQTVDVAIDNPPSMPTARPHPRNVSAGRDGRRASPDTGGLSPGWGWVALGGAAVLAGTGVVLGVQTLDTLEAFEKSGNSDPSLRDHTITYRTWTNVAFGGAIVAGGVGVVLLVVASKRPTSPPNGAPQAVHRPPRAAGWPSF